MKVIVADDEKWVRAAIVRTIPFEALGLELICEASNGIEALELCKLHKPQILVTDLKMPGLTGLELIKELSTELPQIKIVIISGYSDFEYAKEAMAYGVRDYVLKPVDEKEIYSVLSKLRDSIISEKKNSEENMIIKNQYYKSLDVLQEQLFNKLVLPNNSTLEEVKDSCRQLGIDMGYPYFTVIISVPEKVRVNSIKENDYYNIILKRSIKRYLKTSFCINLIRMDEIITIINHQYTDIQNDLIKALRLFGIIVERRLGLVLHMGVSTSSRQILNLYSLANQANQAMKQRFYDNQGVVYFFGNQTFEDGLKINISESDIDKHILNLKTSKIDSIEIYIKELGLKIRHGSMVKPDSVKEFFWVFLQMVASKLLEQKTLIGKESERFYSGSFKKIMSSETLEILLDNTYDVIRFMCKFYNDQYAEADYDLIEKAKKFIENNFDKNLTLEQAARYVHLNPTYFSELFKKETGMSFVDHKTNLRMEYAKKLLSTTNQSIDKISWVLGYTDPKYFSKLFKKNTGFTPQSYKKNNSALE